MVFRNGQSMGLHVRIVMFTICCLTGWVLGQLLAHVSVNISITPAAIHSEQMEAIKRNAIPPPKRQKCNRWSPCPSRNFAFQLTSGGGAQKYPKFCFEDEIILEELNAGKGINIAAVNASSGKVIDTTHFDMWKGDNSGAMVKFIQQIPNRSFVLMTTFDEGSTKLKPEAKMEIEKLGSTLINKIAFRASWVFLGAKGFTLPDVLNKEKIYLSNKKTNKYRGWPTEVQIDGCVPQQ